MHEKACQFLRAMTLPFGLECEHGYDVCPTCDPCTCKSMDAKSLACLDAIHGALYDGESPNPNDHTEDCAWLEGYAEGLAYGRDKDHGICAEFHRRGYVSGDHANLDPTWKSWKRGFNAGRLYRAMSIATGEREQNSDLSREGGK